MMFFDIIDTSRIFGDVGLRAGSTSLVHGSTSYVVATSYFWSEITGKGLKSKQIHSWVKRDTW